MSKPSNFQRKAMQGNPFYDQYKKIIDQHLPGAVEHVVKIAADPTHKDQMSAFSILMERLYPKLKYNPVDLGIDRVPQTPSELRDIGGKVIQQVTSGNITPQDGEGIMKLVTQQAQNIETSKLDELQAELDGLKEQLDEQKTN